MFPHPTQPHHPSLPLSPTPPAPSTPPKQNPNGTTEDLREKGTLPYLWAFARSP